MTRSLILAVLLACATPAFAELPATASETDRLVFATRTWPEGEAGVHWDVTREVRTPAPGVGPVTGMDLGVRRITGTDGRPELELSEAAPDATARRVLARYPMGEIDPTVIWFLETTARSMAGLSGGSPDYIRNRIKDALRKGGDVATTDAGTSVTLTPFAADPNAARMEGFETLTMTITLAGTDPAQPIAGFAAEAPGADFALRATRKAAP